MTHDEEFICEELIPVAGTADVGAMTRREPGLPQRFTWRGQEYRVVGIVKQWKSHSRCKTGANEMYLRRHWYQIVTDPAATMTVYFDRQAKSSQRPKARWWVYSVRLENNE